MARNEIKIFKALSDETRLSIVEFLKEGEKCVCKIIPMTGKSQPTVSQHLRILSEAGILESRKEGTSVYYKIKDKRVIKVLQTVRD
jgi:ArsR family transcriptional regulator